jgi:glycosyltransferase involved in cell wall biosynthesis
MLNQSQLDGTISPSNPPGVAPDPIALPRISIVVPNYQGGATLAQTLQSLIDQNYPDLEIIVVDGGSTDNSLEIIHQMESHITWWVSEADRGQSHAINKGFAQCQGDVVNWLCSDDLLAPGALHQVGTTFAQFPHIDVLVGRSRIEYEAAVDHPGKPITDGNRWLTALQQFLPLGTMLQVSADGLVYLRETTLEQIQLMPASTPIHQPSCFYRRHLLSRPEPVDERYHYTMDIELFNYFYASGAQWLTTSEILSIAPVSGQNKSSVAGIKATYELEQIYQTYAQERIPLTYWHRQFRYPLERFLKLKQGAGFYWVVPLWFMITLTLAPFYGLKKTLALRWTSWI